MVACHCENYQACTLSRCCKKTESEAVSLVQHYFTVFLLLSETASHLTVPLSPVFCSQPAVGALSAYSTFSPGLRVFCANPVSEDLFRAGGGDVEQSPSSVGVELLLVSTQSPHVHHPEHFFLMRRKRTKHLLLKRVRLIIL